MIIMMMMMMMKMMKIKMMNRKMMMMKIHIRQDNARDERYHTSVVPVVPRKKCGTFCGTRYKISTGQTIARWFSIVNVCKMYVLFPCAR